MRVPRDDGAGALGLLGGAGGDGREVEENNLGNEVLNAGLRGGTRAVCASNTTMAS